jgi:hypothetical protein
MRVPWLARKKVFRHGSVGSECGRDAIAMCK